MISGEHMSSFAKSVKTHVVAMTRGARTPARGYSNEELNIGMYVCNCHIIRQ